MIPSQDENTDTLENLQKKCADFGGPDKYHSAAPLPADLTPASAGIAAAVCQDSPAGDPCSEDAEAFVELFCASRARLWQLIRYRLNPTLRRRVGIDDVLQEVYLQASARYEAYLSSDLTNSYLWLRSVALQTLSNIHRFHYGTQLRNLSRERHVDAGPAASSPDPLHRLAAALTTPSEVVVRSETVQRVQQALERLSPNDREIIELRQFEELANDEAADLLKITPKAASIRYVRALGRLRMLIEPSDSEFPSC